MNKKGNNTAGNKTMELNKNTPDKLVGKFKTLNKTGRKSYFDQSWRPRAARYSDI